MAPEKGGSEKGWCPPVDTLLAQYDAALEEYTALTEDPEAREKHVHEALWAVDEMVGDLAEALRDLLA